MVKTLKNWEPLFCILKTIVTQYLPFLKNSGVSFGNPLSEACPKCVEFTEQEIKILKLKIRRILSIAGNRDEFPEILSVSFLKV